MATKKTIEKIILKNFKAFRQEQIIDFKNKNVLIYGNNGAGKSSIFWAIYTFLQSSIKSQVDVEKYFRVFNAIDDSTKQSLRNVFEAGDASSYIELHIREEGELKTYTIPTQAKSILVTPAMVEAVAPENITIAEVQEVSPENITAAIIEEVNAKDITSAQVVEVPVDLSPINPVAFEPSEEEIIDNNIKLLNTTSDFINYKLLSGFYSNSHKYDVNLWNVFERDIFPFITDDINDKTFLEKIIDTTTDIERYDSGYGLKEGWRKREYNERLEAFNVEIDNKLGAIQQYANEFIKEHFYNDKDVLKVELNFDKRFNYNLVEQKIWEDDKKAIRESSLQIKLVVHQWDVANAAWIPLQRVQSFLNEAQLTRIALGIRIGALRTRMQTTEFKLLVLDDMLISLDLSNRMEVVKIILNHDNKMSLKFFDSFQKIILTHDKGFYNILKNYTNANEWEYYKLTKDENSHNAPNLAIDKTHIEKASKFFADGEYDAVGNELRKEVEMVIKKYLNKKLDSESEEFKTLSSMLKSAYENYTLNERRAFNKIFVDKTLPIATLKKIESDFENDDNLNDDEKFKLKTLKKELNGYLYKQYEVKEEKEKIFTDLKTILDRIMNPASHATGETMYAKELEQAITTVKELKTFLEAKKTEV